MAKVVCIHGISQEYESRDTLLDEWAPAVCGGVSNAGGTLSKSDVDLAFYAEIFRPLGSTKGAFESSALKPGDVGSDFEEALLIDLFNGLDLPDAAAGTTKAGAVQRTVASMLQALAKTPYFGGKAQSLVIWYLKQVRLYVTDSKVRGVAQEALRKTIADDTRVVVAHSLGSVVAYELLCANKTLNIDTLVTIGSPLGLPALLPRLLPPVDKVGPWPGNVRQWINIADKTDIVALAKALKPIYGSRVVDHLVDNGATMHDATRYLTAIQTGEAVLSGLSRGA